QLEQVLPADHRNGQGQRQGLLHCLHHVGLLLPFARRGSLGLFPRKMVDYYRLLHRLHDRYDFGHRLCHPRLDRTPRPGLALLDLLAHVDYCHRYR
ncbi:hypothetical protein BGW38_010486, partial [Lunasporangiospora selenospora]